MPWGLTKQVFPCWSKRVESAATIRKAGMVWYPSKVRQGWHWNQMCHLPWGSWHFFIHSVQMIYCFINCLLHCFCTIIIILICLLVTRFLFILLAFSLCWGCKHSLLCDSGEKKQHRKELIAKKRQQRMLSRGVDLGQINTVSHFFTWTELGPKMGACSVVNAAKQL